MNQEANNSLKTPLNQAVTTANYILGDSQVNQELTTTSTEVISEQTQLSISDIIADSWNDGTENNYNTDNSWNDFDFDSQKNSIENDSTEIKKYIPKTSLSPEDLEIVNLFFDTLGYKKGELLRIRGFDEKEKAVTHTTPYPLKQLNIKSKTAYYFLPNSYGTPEDIPQGLSNYQSNNYGYKQAHILAGRTHYMEFDNLTYEEQLTIIEKLKLPKPTLAIHTGGKSIHYYWVLKEPTPAKQWRVLQDKLMDYLSDSDTSLRDISQLMRLPQCPYVSKEKKYSGKETTILHDLCDRSLRYTHEDLDKVIPITPKLDRTSSKMKKAPVTTDSDKVPDLVVLLHGLGLKLPTDAYLAKALEDEYLIVANLTDDRNNYLCKASFSLGQLVHQGLDEKLIKDIMLQASYINSKILKEGKEKEEENKKIIKDLINRALECGKANPRSDRPQSDKDLKEKAKNYKKFIDNRKIIDELQTGFDGILTYDDDFMDWFLYDDKLKHFDKKSVTVIEKIIEERRIQLSKNYCNLYGIPEDHPVVFHNPDYADVVKLCNTLRLRFVGNMDHNLNNYLPLANGMLNLETLELTDHHPSYRNTYCLPHEYQPTAECPLFLDWLENEALTNKEDILIIQAFFYATLTGMGVHKFLELVGRPRSGKGTLMRVLITLMGSKNSASTDLDTLENSNYIMPKVIDKRLIAISETEEKHDRKITRFLGLTGRDAMKIEEKFKPIREDKTFQGLVLFASNYRLTGKDPAKALDSRRITVHVDNNTNPKERIPLCEDIRGIITGKFVPEMSGILNWVLSIDPHKAKQVLNNPSEYIKHYLQTTMKNDIDGDRLEQFIEDTLVIDPDGIVYPKELYEKYSQYCQEETGNSWSNNFKSPQGLINKIKLLLDNKFKVKYKVLPRTNKGNRYQGFRIANANDPENYGLISQAYKLDNNI
ncbi:DUF5906 domain-containing protein [Geminocystis sp.]|uniref:DNA primase family protein n=1 Tax=Geminocystis sp. TaxID=2664100 RepID=UPI0035931E93